MPTKYEKKKKYGWLLILIVLAIVIGFVFLFIWMFTYRSLAFVFVFAALNLFGVAGIFLLLIQLDRARKRSMLLDYAAIETKKQVVVLGLPEEEKAQEPKDSDAEKERDIIIQKIAELFYSGDRKDKRCRISNKEFKPNDVIIRCLICGSLFLQDNLVEWLLDNDTCPYCKRSIIEKESLTEN
ncbi:MAG: hypothetical protein JXA54_02655 [Candidatus Heimdallarchaeota archaeon]|nr:hypothetical protein [Candidatus Heimdallarchaeota archaeon]